MSQNQGFAKPSQNASDWDTDLNANFTLLERGYVVPRVVGLTTINTGQVVHLNASAQLVPYDANSFDLGPPFGIATQQTSPGNTANPIVWGSVSSNAGWNFGAALGQPLYVAIGSPGLLVTSFAGAMVQAGFAVGSRDMVFRPNIRPPERRTFVGCGFLAGPTGTFSFALTAGRRGIVRDLTIQTVSVNNFSVTFWANSAQTEILYQTRITSGQIAVNTVRLRDAALWPYEATDTASPLTIYGRIDVTSSAVLTNNSGAVSVSLVLEQLR